MILYVFDRRWGYPAFAAKHPSTIRVDTFYVEAIHKIATIAVFIRQHAKQDKISLLRLCGHGNAGFLQLGEGLDESTAIHLKPIGKLLASGSKVEIHGCGVASASPLTHTQLKGTDRQSSVGRRFMKALANAVNAPVTAGIDAQLGDKSFVFEGKTVTVKP